MTTYVPRPPYSQEELDRLYPKQLKLQLVQVVRRNDLSSFSQYLYISLLEKKYTYYASANQT